MIQTTFAISPDRPHLLQLLSGLSATKLRASERNLAAQLAQLMSVSESVSMSRVLSQLPTQAVGQENIEGAKHMQDDVLHSRGQMIEVVIRSFATDSESSRVKAPHVWANTDVAMLQTYQPYQRFYKLHQVEMATGVQAVRRRVRTSLAGLSPELHRLSELDKLIEDSLLVQTNKLFRVIPSILEQRFHQLLASYQHGQQQGEVIDRPPESWLAAGGWLQLFYQDQRELLLAELDVRLQPVFGLLEALNNHLITQ